MMNVSRRDALGRVVPGEPNQAQNYITTAGDKSCFMYQKLIEMTEMEVLDPDNYFVWGLDFRVPVMHGLLSKQFLDEQRLSTTFDEASFARESLSIWTGQSKDSWFSNKQLIRHRNLLKAEPKALANPTNKETFYILSYDVARYGVNSALIVCKVLPQPNGEWKKKIVYVHIIKGESLIDQAAHVKKWIQQYNPREMVIDGNGLGAGLMDAMVKPSYNPEDGITYPPYYAFNDEEYVMPGFRFNPDKVEPKPENRMIIYNMKASGSGVKDNNSEIHANIFSQIAAGNVDFLANERVVKTKLLATKKGQKMTLYDRREFLLPYEMTSRLMDEMNNLKLKPTGIQNKIDIEQISRSMPKDRFSALEYGLWRVKYYEDQAIKKRKRTTGIKDMLRFTPKRGVKKSYG